MRLTSPIRSVHSLRSLVLSGLVACVLAVLFPGGAAAATRAPTPQLINRDLRSGQIGRDTATLYLAYALGRPGKLPAAYRSNAPWDGTLPLRRLLQKMKQMEPGPLRDRVEAIVAPVERQSTTCGSSGGSLASEAQTTHFYVEYGTIGAGLGINAYLASLEVSWSKEVTSFGWAAPPVDANPAPGGKYHVRIDNLGSGLYGFVSPSGTHAGLVGNNPSTSWNEGDAYASCMVLNNDYDEAEFPSSAQASLDSTTAHEFNHSLQFGYGALNGSNAPDDVFVEGGATWMEDEVYDSANDNYNYLWPAFYESMGAYDLDFPYPYWITFRGLTERYGTGSAGGGEDVMQRFWEETSRGTGSNLTAMQTAVASKGTTLAAAFHAYAIAVKFNRSCGGGYAYPYCFQEGAAYLGAAGATVPHKTIAAVGGTAASQVEDNYALNWVRLPATGGPYDVTLENQSGGGTFRGTVACDTGTGLLLAPLPGTVGAGGNGAVQGFSPASCSGGPFLVITNEAQTAPNPSSSALRSYTVSTASSPANPQTLTVSTSGSGVVTSTPGGITCGVDCSQIYDLGTPVTLAATPAAGWRFSGWSGACDGLTCNLNMTSSRSVHATFVRDSPRNGDRVRPRLWKLAVSPTRFRAARSGPSAAAVTGTTVRYLLSERARTRFRVQRAKKGRLVGGRCVKASPANSDRRRCTRWVLMGGAFTRTSHAGVNRFRFRGRLSGRALRPHRYRLIARATDAAGNRSAVRRTRFRIIR